ncbi:MAG: glutathione S-transferase family protein [Gammaproteobacteria bacterium]
MTDDRIALRGSPGSPYTRKMLAVLRYRRIPYEFIQSEREDLPKPRVGLIPIFYFPDNQGALQAEVDSTPIIRRLETEYPGRSVMPEDTVIGFINYLLEDYGDEWLTKAMFHYRWYYRDDIELAGSVLPHYQDVSQPDETIAQMKQMFSERQISRLYVVGSNDTTAPVIEASYRRFLECLNEHLKTWPFLMGTRPGSADFACFGQLTQLTQFDPTPAKVAAADFPRIHAWVSKMEDQSGLQTESATFVTTEDFPATLTALLIEVGRTYVPVMLANAAAIDQGLDRVETEVEGRQWVQEPFPYQAKCLHWLRSEYARLDDQERRQVDALLAGTGCEMLLTKSN